MQTSLSMRYCKPGIIIGGYQASNFGPAASCIALVEVAGNQAQARKLSTVSGCIHVEPNHDAVVARFFFVYNNSKEMPALMDTTRMAIPAWGVPCATC